MLLRKNKLYDPLLPDNPKKTSRNKIKTIITWIKKNPRKSIPLICLVLVVIGLIVWLLWPSKPQQSRVKPVQPPKPQIFYSKLTGNQVTEEQSKLPVIAVMIENSPEARPQSGLQQAGVVFESVAEGGITRFLALYQEDQPEVIGPVRSVRPQFASWVAAFDAGLAHVGGSDIPLRKLRSGQIKDLDQFFNAGSYYQSSSRFAPHNTYTSYGRLEKLAKSKGYTKSEFTSWTRKKIDEDEKPSKDSSAKKESEVAAAKPAATSLQVPVSTGNFAVSYSWDQKTKKYTRLQAGVIHKDQEKGDITADVVIVMQVPHDVIRDSNGYSYPDVNTSGKAWVFQDGVVEEISWEKTSDKEQIVFTDGVGKQIQLNRGRTWISAIRPDTSPSW